MSVFRIVGLVAVLGSLVACAADDTDQNETTSEKTNDATTTQSAPLSDPGGLGEDVPMPLPPGPWDDPDWTPPRTAFDPDRDHDPLGPEHFCALDYLKIYDPSRSKDIEVPIVRCD